MLNLKWIVVVFGGLRSENCVFIVMGVEIWFLKWICIYLVI